MKHGKTRTRGRQRKKDRGGKRRNMSIINSSIFGRNVLLKKKGKFYKSQEKIVQ